MEKPLAARLIEALAALDAPIGKLVKEITDPGEKAAFIQTVGDLKGHIYSQIMVPILRGHPDLDPDKSRRKKLAEARKVVIRERPYFCYQDEKHFFGWLESIRGVLKVVGGPDGLTIHFARAPLSYDSWADLLGVFARYGVDMRPLCVLVDKRHEAWLRDPDKYWHEAMWSEAKRRPAIDLPKKLRLRANRRRSARPRDN
jgi:hypothetical protein